MVRISVGYHRKIMYGFLRFFGVACGHTAYFYKVSMTVIYVVD